MDKQNFSQITSELYFEYSKLSDVTDTDCVISKRILRKLNKLLFKRFKRDTQMCMKDEKYNQKVLKAMSKLPRGKVWIFFHKRLYRDIQKYLETAKQDKTEEKQESGEITVPVISPEIEILKNN